MAQQADAEARLAESERAQCDAAIKNMQAQAVAGERPACADPARKAEFCARLRTGAGWRLVDGAGRDGAGHQGRRPGPPGGRQGLRRRPREGEGRALRQGREGGRPRLPGRAVPRRGQGPGAAGVRRARLHRHGRQPLRHLLRQGLGRQPGGQAGGPRRRRSPRPTRRTPRSSRGRRRSRACWGSRGGDLRRSPRRRPGRRPPGGAPRTVPCRAAGAAAVRAPDGPRDRFPGAATAYLVSLDGRELWARQPDRPLPPASLTKLMTALLALEAGGSRRRRWPSAPAPPPPPGPGSGSGPARRSGPADLLEAMLVTSSNDACLALAEHLGGSEAAFVARMNARAAALGLGATRFVNACGHDAAGPPRLGARPHAPLHPGARAAGAPAAGGARAGHPRPPPAGGRSSCAPPTRCSAGWRGRRGSRPASPPGPAAAWWRWSSGTAPGSWWSSSTPRIAGGRRRGWSRRPSWRPGAVAEPAPAGAGPGGRAAGRARRGRRVAARPGGRALVAGAALLAYATSFAGGFQFDDWNVIVEEPRVQTLGAWWQSLPAIRPLLKLTFALNLQSGLGLFGFHLVNVLVHAGAALAAMGVVARVERGPGLGTVGRGAGAGGGRCSRRSSSRSTRSRPRRSPTSPGARPRWRGCWRWRARSPGWRGGSGGAAPWSTASRRSSSRRRSW